MRKEIEDLIGLVKFDYEHSLKLIDGVVRVSIGIRTIAMAGCLALLAAAMQTEQVFLAGAAFLATAVFGVQDAYHGWLYAEARGHADRLESLIDAYYRLVQGKPSKARELQLLKRLRRHGCFGSRPTVAGPVPPRSRARQAEWRGETTPVTRAAIRLRAFWLLAATRTIIGHARPRIVYALLYPLLGAISLAVVVALLLDAEQSRTDVSPTRICIACDSKAEFHQP